jgi:hypothetical protein
LASQNAEVRSIIIMMIIIIITKINENNEKIIAIIKI